MKMFVLEVLVWAMFLGDVLFLFGYAVLPPRSWHRHPMGWHLVAWSTCFGILTGSSVLSIYTGPLPYWLSVLELAAVVAVILWRAFWMLHLKFGRRIKATSPDELAKNSK